MPPRIVRLNNGMTNASPRVPQQPISILKRPSTIPTVPTPSMIKKLVPENLVVHASAATPTSSSSPPLPISSPPPSTPAPSPQTQMTTIAQIIADQLRVQFKAWELKVDNKLESTVRDIVGSALRDLKVQFETSQIIGEALNDKIPVFARPDPSVSIEHTLAKGVKLKLFHPIVSNVHGYWMTTPYVTPNGAVVSGYVPIFSVKLTGVDYMLSKAELKTRAEQWKGHLDQLSDKDFIPNIGKFTESF